VYGVAKRGKHIIESFKYSLNINEGRGVIAAAKQGVAGHGKSIINVADVGRPFCQLGR